MLQKLDGNLAGVSLKLSDPGCKQVWDHPVIPHRVLPCSGEGKGTFQTWHSVYVCKVDGETWDSWCYWKCSDHCPVCGLEQQAVKSWKEDCSRSHDARSGKVEHTV